MIHFFKKQPPDFSQKSQTTPPSGKIKIGIPSSFSDNLFHPLIFFIQSVRQSRHRPLSEAVPHLCLCIQTTSVSMNLRLHKLLKMLKDCLFTCYYHEKHIQTYKFLSLMLHQFYYVELQVIRFLSCEVSLLYAGMRTYLLFSFIPDPVGFFYCT